ncbi:MAG: hypothetical protein EXS25_12440 [Pedosphaera sp.]|nr:hypothetical protein [Pedosphaera sp.]
MTAVTASRPSWRGRSRRGGTAFLGGRKQSDRDQPDPEKPPAAACDKTGQAVGGHYWNPIL